MMLNGMEGWFDPKVWFPRKQTNSEVNRRKKQSEMDKQRNAKKRGKK